MLKHKFDCWLYLRRATFSTFGHIINFWRTANYFESLKHHWLFFCYYSTGILLFFVCFTSNKFFGVTKFFKSIKLRFLIVRFFNSSPNFGSTTTCWINPAIQKNKHFTFVIFADQRSLKCQKHFPIKNWSSDGIFLRNLFCGIGDQKLTKNRIKQ